MCIRDRVWAGAVAPEGGCAANRCKVLQTAASGLQHLVHVCRYTSGAGRSKSWRLIRPNGRLVLREASVGAPDHCSGQPSAPASPPSARAVPSAWQQHYGSAAELCRSPGALGRLPSRVSLPMWLPFGASGRE
eukprot:14904708-Alexandrium_andersonii.AAC.1